MDGKCGRRKSSVLTKRMRGVWDEFFLGGGFRQLWQEKKRGTDDVNVYVSIF